MKKKNSDQPISEELMAAGMLNVLSVGYKGVELWRQHRIPLEIELEAKDDEKEA